MKGADWYVDTNYFRFQEFDICYKQSSNSQLPVILLLHGFPTCSYDWYKVWPLLESTFHLVAFDFLGFGRSDKPYPHNYSIEEQGDIALACIESLGIRECFILAHDYAVSVGQELLSRVEEGSSEIVIPKLIFLNGGLFSETHRAMPIQKMLLGRFGWIVNKFLSKKSLTKNFNKIFGPDTPPSEEEMNEIWELINYNKGKRVFRLLIRYILDRQRNRDRWVANMQSNHTKLLLLNGPEDPISGRHLVDRYKELIPNPKTVMLENIGHYPSLESPTKVAEHTLDFFLEINKN
jgi:pimeloyl-ACP methyl ester carboxylesterase